MSCNKEIEVLVYLAISSSVAFAAPEQTNISFTAVIFSEGSLGIVANNEDNSAALPRGNRTPVSLRL